jgi:hypothetical protein
MCNQDLVTLDIASCQFSIVSINGELKTSFVNKTLYKPTLMALAFNDEALIVLDKNGLQLLSSRNGHLLRSFNNRILTEERRIVALVVDDSLNRILLLDAASASVIVMSSLSGAIVACVPLDVLEASALAVYKSQLFVVDKKAQCIKVFCATTGAFLRVIGDGSSIRAPHCISINEDAELLVAHGQGNLATFAIDGELLRESRFAQFSALNVDTAPHTICQSHEGLVLVMMEDSVRVLYTI